MDTGKRTILKAILWNTLGLAMMSVVGFVMTGSVFLGGTIALTNTMIGLLTYILYERIWSRIAWGRHV
ncbi:hypothetical protein DEA8626_00691 [Defluviimonas aquaemixtae]|uniref:DUF2061 domain-containing protein n=1 Tax=Albidovulum aquaemixtae TaxID=1542388 RepID=A0A2R8B3K5_9RHOB|nr:DUF2061 domain-containing protein [Defluviimonas aquaemixtae]SPH17175.1 hypothetical protein DEA8626_00691 [Defluviimonas aquaemixtae]